MLKLCYSGNRGTSKDPSREVPRRQGNVPMVRNPQQGGKGGDNKSFSAMSTAEKVARCCGEFNSAKGCSFKDCKKPHICSKVLARGQVCWKGGHSEFNHK